MEIESVQVIPMRGESIWEDARNPFEVAGITTSYDEWLAKMKAHDAEEEQIEIAGELVPKSMTFEDECIEFAKKQQGFMINPVAKFGDIIYMANAVKTETLQDFMIYGPLYKIKKNKDHYLVRYGIINE